jgi:hypothetical protein
MNVFNITDYNQDQAVDSERKRVGTHLLYSGGAKDGCRPYFYIMLVLVK